MPVKWLLHWQPSPSGQITSQTLMDVMKSIESINGVRTGRWQVIAAQYRPNQRDPGVPVECARELLGLTFSEVPSKQFFVLRAEHMVVEAAASMHQIMEKLQLYRNRLTIFFEGFQYQLGDFQIKAGRAVLAHSETLRGIIVEVEYLPVSSLEQTRLLLQEFVDLWQDVVSAQSMSGRLVPLEPNFADYGLSDHYCWQHTALQVLAKEWRQELSKTLGKQPVTSESIMSSCKAQQRLNRGTFRLVNLLAHVMPLSSLTSLLFFPKHYGLRKMSLY